MEHPSSLMLTLRLKSWISPPQVVPQYHLPQCLPCWIRRMRQCLININFIIISVRSSVHLFTGIFRNTSTVQVSISVTWKGGSKEESSDRTSLLTIISRCWRIPILFQQLIVVPYLFPCIFWQCFVQVMAFWISGFSYQESGCHQTQWSESNRFNGERMQINDSVPFRFPGQ